MQGQSREVSCQPKPPADEMNSTTFFISYETGYLLCVSDSHRNKGSLPASPSEGARHPCNLRRWLHTEPGGQRIRRILGGPPMCLGRLGRTWYVSPSPMAATEVGHVFTPRLRRYGMNRTILDTNFLEECRQELAQSLRDGTQFMESPSEKWSTKRCLQETGTCQEAGTSRELSGRPVQSLKMSPCCWRFIPRVLCLTNYAVGSSDVGLEHGGDPKPV